MEYPDDVILRRGPARDVMPAHLQARVEAGAERIRRARMAIARDAKVELMP
jgi:hypothetical protein